MFFFFKLADFYSARGQHITSLLISEVKYYLRSNSNINYFCYESLYHCVCVCMRTSIECYICGFSFYKGLNTLQCDCMYRVEDQLESSADNVSFN